MHQLLEYRDKSFQVQNLLEMELSRLLFDKGKCVLRFFLPFCLRYNSNQILIYQTIVAYLMSILKAYWDWN